MKSVLIIECSTVPAQVFFYLHANGLMNPDVFYPKTFCIPQNFSSSGIFVLEELGSKQTDKLTHSLTSY